MMQAPPLKLPTGIWPGDNPENSLTNGVYGSPPVPYEGPVQGFEGTFKGSEAILVSVSVQLEPTGEKKVVYVDHCINACQGPPPEHAKHEECDRACDLPCESLHEFNYHPITEIHSTGESAFTYLEGISQITEVLSKRGYKVSDQGMEFLDARVSDAMDLASKKHEESVEMKGKHAGMNPFEPCTAYNLEYYAHAYNFVVNVEVLRQFSGQGDPILVPFMKPQKYILGTMEIFSPDPLLDKEIRCLCGEHQDDPPVTDGATGYLGGDYMPLDYKPKTFGQLDMEYSKTGISAVGTDLNNLVLNLPMGQGCSIPAGTLWIPEDSAYQVMTTMETATVKWGFLAFNGSAFAPSQVNIKTLCTEAEKKEPNGKVRYLPQLTADSTLRTMMQKVDASRIKGPWDQVRTWIYTDKIPYAKAARRLIPSVTEGRYLSLVHEVASLPQMKKGNFEGLKKLVEPAMLLHPDARATARDWAFQLMRGNKGQMEAALKVEKAETWAQKAPEPTAKAFADVMKLLSKGPKELRGQWASKLLSQLPSSIDEQFIKAGGAKGLAMTALLVNSDERVKLKPMLQRFAADESCKKALALTP